MTDTKTLAPSLPSKQATPGAVRAAEAIRLRDELAEYFADNSFAFNKLVEIIDRETGSREMLEALEAVTLNLEWLVIHDNRTEFIERLNQCKTAIQKARGL